jgi:hypothetical protein
MIRASFSWEDVPIPRLWIRTHWREHEHNVFERTAFELGVEISSRYGNPVLEITVTQPWRRPRPWDIRGQWPAAGGRRFIWKRS